MNKNLFEEISNYIVKTVQEGSTLEGFQYVVSEADIWERFGKEIYEYINDKIMEEMVKREEIAEIYLDTDGFDVTLYTDFAPNYNNIEEE